MQASEGQNRRGVLAIPFLALARSNSRLYAPGKFHSGLVTGNRTLDRLPNVAVNLRSFVSTGPIVFKRGVLPS